MALLDQLALEMTAAMKARDEARLSALRMIKAALMKQKVDSPKPLDEAAEMAVLKMLIKQRAEAAEVFRQAGRAEQAAKEDAERAIIEAYLPAGASDSEIDAAITAALAEVAAAIDPMGGAQPGPKQMGAVMKATQARLQGKTVDGKALSEKVRARLSA